MFIKLFSETFYCSNHHRYLDMNGISEFWWVIAYKLYVAKGTKSCYTGTERTYNIL